MALNAREISGGGSDIPPMEPGTYPGRLTHVIGLGLQPQIFENEEKAPQQEIQVVYELSDEFLKDEDGEDDPKKPRWLYETFALHNLAADRAKSTQRYFALDPTEEHGGDWAKLIGLPCMITVINKVGTKGKNKGKVFNNVASISAMRSKEAAKLPALVHPTKFFDPSEPDIEVFMSLNDKLKDKIVKGLEYGGSDLERLVRDYKPKEKDAEPKAKKPKAEVVEEEDDEAKDGVNW